MNRQQFHADLALAIYQAETDYLETYGEAAPIEITINAVLDSRPVEDLKKENELLHNLLNKALVEITRLIEWPYLDGSSLGRVKQILQSYEQQLELNVNVQ